jgi:hypothetical protein
VYPPLFHTLDLPSYKRALLSASETDLFPLSDTSPNTEQEHTSNSNCSIIDQTLPNTTTQTLNNTMSDNNNSAQQPKQGGGFFGGIGNAAGGLASGVGGIASGLFYIFYPSTMTTD